MTTGIGLFSGGLDSILAVRVLQEQNIDIVAVCFITPFFGAETAKKAAEQLKISLHIADITEKHLEMLKNPKHGYGRNMNPCIDCHALMFNHAGQMMDKLAADFLFSGEVLGERPMSQNKNSLRTVAGESGFGEHIIRPLSALLLPVTKPEEEGIVDRKKLLDIKGRSRKPQLKLVKQFGITYYPGPAGGCLLTDPSFSRRLRDLLENNSASARRDFDLLSVGRHFRINSKIKIIVGRNEIENKKIMLLSLEGDTIITPDDVPGPVVIIPHGAGLDDKTVKLASSICARYSDAEKGTETMVTVFHNNLAKRTQSPICPEQLVQQLII